MMPYYDNEQNPYWIDGIVVLLTEEQAEHYQGENLESDIESATESDYLQQMKQYANDADELSDYTSMMVAWVENKPVLIEEQEWSAFQLQNVDFDVSLEYVTQRNGNSDVIDCKCDDANNYTCDDCYDFFQSLLDD